MTDALKVHLVTRRAELLADFSITAAGWIMLLHTCTAEPSERDQLQELVHDVIAFKEWADQSLIDLGLPDCSASLARERMPDDPLFVASMRKLIANVNSPQRSDRG